jgi:hypothetical protein
MDSNVIAASEMATRGKVTYKTGYNSASKVACKWKASRPAIDCVSKAVSEVEAVTEAAFKQLSLKHLLVLLKSQWITQPLKNCGTIEEATGHLGEI